MFYVPETYLLSETLSRARMRGRSGARPARSVILEARRAQRSTRGAG